ncbi:LD-carboxypeptidase [Streptomyces sp. NPDC005780]|uniref:LD-carboxypeptidase n=1 Tax=Streptomyces sp. NPDC005780 TaxID=3364730 RepID=UPI00368CDF27
MTTPARTSWHKALPTSEPASDPRFPSPLNTLLRDPEVRAIVALDGGQTAFGYLDLIDIEAIRSAMRVPTDIGRLGPAWPVQTLPRTARIRGTPAHGARTGNVAVSVR